MQKVLEAHVRAHLDELAEGPARSRMTVDLRLRRRRGAAARLGRRAEARSAAHRLGMGRPLPHAELARRRRARALPHQAHALHEGDHGRAVAGASGAAHRVHEGSPGRRHGSGQLLPGLHHPPGAGTGAGGAADRRARQAQLAPAHRPADRGEPGAPGQGEAGALARRRQHHAVEGVRRRHPDHDRRQLGGRAALDPGALHLPRRGRRLSGLGRRGRRSGLARRGAVARPSRTGARCSWPRRRRSAGSPGSSASTRRPTSGATSWPARIAATTSG